MSLPLDQVLEAAGRRDEDVRALARFGLRPERRAAVDGATRERFAAASGLELGCDLERELAGRDEHERAGLRVRAGEALDDRDPEGERLAGAGRRFGEDVEPGERLGEDEVLDRERCGDAAGGEDGRDGRAHAKRLKDWDRCSTPCFRAGFEMQQTRIA